MHDGISIVEIIRHALVVTAFVFAMMTLIDYLNVVTEGKLESFLKRSRRRQYVGCAFLGATPGCLGAFAVTSLYAHRMLSFGAIVACMLATSGDEAFVMLALFPGTALVLFGVLFALGLLWGWVSDRAAAIFRFTPCEGCELLTVHEEHLPYFSLSRIPGNIRSPSMARVCIFAILIIFIVIAASGSGHQHLLGMEPHSHAHGERSGAAHHEHDGTDWIAITLVVLLSITAVIVIASPEHYLSEHLWEHLAKRHLWKIFLWVAGTMLAIHYLSERWDLDGFVSAHTAWVLPVAVLVGIIPESGPHLVFVIMFGKGLIPFSVLLASCISQDGHGMLPLLSVSVKDFIWVKAAKVSAALLVGYLAYWGGI